MLNTAPTEILIYIFSELEGKDLSSISQTCRQLNSVSLVDSLWERLCEPLEECAPFPTWHDLYVTTWHRWGWLDGIWCGDSQFVGHMVVCRYNSQTGQMDFHPLRAQLKLSHAIHSVHSNVTVSSFSHKVRPNRRPAFSVPRTLGGPHPRFQRIDTTDNSIFLLQWGEEAGKHLLEYPEDDWPGHLVHTTTAPIFSPFRLSTPHTKIEWPLDSMLLAIARTPKARELFRGGEFPTDDRDGLAIEHLGKISRRLLEPGVGAPYQGLWVGEYSAHGPEFLIFLQRRPNQLEVIKITGDHNVPLAEYSWVVPDLTRTGRTCTETEFEGLQSISGHGQIAGTFFTQPRWVAIEVFLRSYNEVCVMWAALRHASQYRRVDVAEILHPDYYGTEIRDL